MRAFSVAALFTLFATTACSSQPNADTQDTRFRVETVAEQLNFPWSLAFLPDGSYLVAERGGKLQHLTANGQRRAEITGLPAHLQSGGQGGLFDVTLAPDFSRTRHIYIAFAGAGEGGRNTEVMRAQLDVNARTLRNLTPIFKAEKKVGGGQHFGGRMLFGADGKLYITLGDRNIRDQAQNVTNHIGTLVRLNADGSIPADNPTFDAANAAPGVYSYGHRNMQGIALHPVTKAVWTHEHGPRGGDEINLAKAGANYGWPIVTHGREYSGFSITDKTTAEGIEPPVLNWTPSIAPSGMAFYTGKHFPRWQNNMFVGALAGQHLRRVVIEDNKVIEQEELLTDLRERIRDVRNGPDGYLYLLTDSDEGRLLRVVPRE